MSSDPMSDAAIRVVGLGKRYHIGGPRPKYRTARESLTRMLTEPARRARDLLRGHATGAAALHEAIWALRDVDFEVRQGEVVGVIGPNGAGKSTLLKVLSRITDPTTGYAEIRGRVGSLLEVGSGFHPELTGRENIYLNGAILGMRRAEIDRKFDEIVAFSGVEKFIETPVKHFSSGMYVRLAFAVAAHLEPEILVVDEVLSVGDAAFQRKCLNKMDDVASGGRTILFVSHNMGAVTRLCQRALLFDHGRLVLDGEPREVVASYLSSGDHASAEWTRPEDATSPGEMTIRRVRLLDPDGTPQATIPFDRPFSVEVTYTLHRPLRDFTAMCRVEDSDGVAIWSSWDSDSEALPARSRGPGSFRSRCHVPAGLLRPGRYHLSVGGMIRRRGDLDFQERVLSFDVSNVGYRFNPNRLGLITPLLHWAVEANGLPETQTSGALN